jgi:peroxiredoxin family protein
MTQKMAVVCNGDTPASIMPTLILSTSGLSLDYEVHIFICPVYRAGSPILFSALQLVER